MLSRSRPVSIQPPAEVSTHGGLAYALFLPPEAPRGSVLILHGAGSVKENHYDFARAARAHGFAALAFDQRGHGDSEGGMGAGVLDDIAAMAALLPAGPLALRGSSMGGYFAIVGAARLQAAAVVAICPAGSEHLLRGLRAGALPFRADLSSLEAFLTEHDAMLAAAELDGGLLLLHAEGDERIPVGHSIELERVAMRAQPKRLIAVPGGHHRSVQHDGELQGESLRWLSRVVDGA